MSGIVLIKLLQYLNGESNMSTIYGKPEPTKTIEPATPTKSEGKWYIKINCAECSAASVVQLTEAELKIVSKYINAELVADDGYSGSDYLLDTAYDTKEQAVAAARLMATPVQ